MRCHETQNLIHGYLDGELDLVGNLDIEQHLQACGGCSQAYEAQQALRSAVKAGSLYFKPPEELRKRVRSSLRKASKAEARPHLIMPWRLVGAAASLVLVATLSLSLLQVLPARSEEDLLTREIVSDHVRSLMVNHLVDVPSANTHTVKPWFDGKVDFSPRVQDFTGEGFPLIGGRLDYVGNRAVAALVYGRQKHYINLFIWPSTDGREVGNRSAIKQGFNVIHWAKSGMNYWAVSDLNESELQEFAQLTQN